ncbi:(-)-delta-cadinene synthase [Naviculisporaceae sp. PSN 640]
MTESTPTAPPIPVEAKGEKEREFNITNLHSQKLHIPNLWPAFATWKKGINPLYYTTTTAKNKKKNNLRAAIDARLDQLIQDNPAKLAKAKAVDLGLFAGCLFPDPDISYSTLETAAFYLIWLFFWDDAIDSTGDRDGHDIANTVEAGRKYRDESVAYIRYCLQPYALGQIPPQPPTAVCESFGDVAGRIRDIISVRRDGISTTSSERWNREIEGLTGRTSGGFIDETGRIKLGMLGSSLEKYMDACVVEQAWRLSSEGDVSRVRLPPSGEEFWGWRLGTSSVDALLDISVMLNKIDVPLDVLRSEELKDMRLSINKLLVCINELFSLKKELKDNTAHMNLIPITMHASEDSSNLEAAVQKIVKDIYAYAEDFLQKKELLRMSNVVHSATDQGIPVPEALNEFDRLVAAYQAVVTGVLHSSMESPRYGILGDRLSEEEGGGFLVTL